MFTNKLLNVETDLFRAFDPKAISNIDQRFRWEPYFAHAIRVAAPSQERNPEVQDAGPKGAARVDALLACDIGTPRVIHLGLVQQVKPRSRGLWGEPRKPWRGGMG